MTTQPTPQQSIEREDKQVSKVKVKASTYTEREGKEKGK
jgi:hypothetical protein